MPLQMSLKQMSIQMSLKQMPLQMSLKQMPLKKGHQKCHQEMPFWKKVIERNKIFPETHTGIKSFSDQMLPEQMPFEKMFGRQ